MSTPTPSRRVAPLRCRHCNLEWPADERPPRNCPALAGVHRCRSVARHCRSCSARLVRQVCEDPAEFYQRDKCGACLAPERAEEEPAPMTLVIHEMYRSINGIPRYGLFLDGKFLSGETTCWKAEAAWYAREMPFGKYRGYPITEVPTGYLRWMLRKGWLADWAEEELEDRADPDHPLYRPED